MGDFGYGFYCDPSKPVFELDSNATLRSIEAKLSAFPFPPQHVSFSSASLNFCINQLISSTTYLVEVEKGYPNSVFDVLKQAFPKATVLLNPTKEEKLLYWKPNAIYVCDLLTRSPIAKNGRIRIEKLIVDLLLKTNLSEFYSVKGREQAVEALCLDHQVDFQTLFAYARRRGKKVFVYERLEPYLPAEVKEAARNERPHQKQQVSSSKHCKLNIRKIL